MNCPKCNCDMQSGYLQAGPVIAFNKHLHKVSLNPKHEEDVMIHKSAVKASNFNGYICKKCGLVVFDYTTTDVE